MSGAGDPFHSQTILHGDGTALYVNTFFVAPTAAPQIAKRPRASTFFCAARPDLSHVALRLKLPLASRSGRPRVHTVAT
jgi:hypothetical protein